MTTIETQGLTKRYGRTCVLDDVDLSVGRGVTGVLGPNGAGKSTLLKILATVLAPSDGRVSVFGYDPGVATERLEIRRRLGYLPQDPGMYGGFSAFDMVDYVAILKEHTDRDARQHEVRRVLDVVGLTDEMHKKVRRLSGGMRRRVALAAALLGHPELLVLDEPAAGLDPDQRLRFRHSISEIARDHTVLVSTHQTDEVAALCQRVVVLVGGRLRFDGTPAELGSLADGRVWVDEHADPTATRSWLAADGAFRHVGDPPAGATLAAPTIEDGYLLLVTAQEVAP